MADESKYRSAEKTKSESEIAAVELPAPLGWQKKLMPKKGGTPRRNEIVFISPSGEEIRTKRQLDQYLKSHPGGPGSSEFDWGTGDTPRRSSRLSEMSKAFETPERETPKKRGRLSSSKKVADEENDVAEAEESAEAKNDGSVEGENPKKRGRKSSSKKVADEENDVAEADESAEAKNDGSVEGEKPKKRGRKSSAKKGAKKEVEEADESVEGKKDAAEDEAKVSADVEMKDSDTIEEKTEGKGSAFNIDVDAEVAVNTAAENAGDGAIELNSQNKTEGCLKDIPVESTDKGIPEADESAEARKDGAEEEANVSADIEMKEPAETGEKTDGEGSAVNKDVAFNAAAENAGDGSIEQNSENKTEEGEKVKPVEYTDKGVPEADDFAEARKDGTEEEVKASAEIEMKEPDESGEKTEGEGSAVNKDVAVNAAADNAGDGAIEQDSENRSTDKGVPEAEARKEGAEEAKVSADIEMKEPDGTGENIEVEGSAVNAAAENAGDGVMEQDSDTKIEGSVIDLSVESTDKGVPEGARDGVPEKKTDIQEDAINAAVENARDGAVEQDSDSKTEWYAKEMLEKEINVQEDALKAADAGASRVHKDQEKADTNPNDAVASYANKVQEQADTNPTDAVDSNVHKDQKQADANLTDAAIPISNLNEDASAVNGENERKELPEDCHQKDNEETSVANGTPPSAADGQHQPKTSPISC